MVVGGLWSSDNRVKLNSDKCKELRILFARNQLLITRNQLLGVTVTNNLSLLNEHINDIVKKASKRLYFLV